MRKDRRCQEGSRYVEKNSTDPFLVHLALNLPWESGSLLKQKRQAMIDVVYYDGFKQ